MIRVTGLSISRRVRLAAMVAGFVLLGAMPTQAAAQRPEAGTNAPPAVGPGASQKPSGGVVIEAATGMYCQVGGYQDGVDWAFVQSVPDSYVTGSCYDGWSFARQVCSPSLGCGGYGGGYVFGNFNGCGWIKGANLRLTGGTNPTTACQSPSRALSEFASYVNCNPGTCSDGTDVGIIAGCGTYANARPWSSSWVTDYLRSRYPPYTMKWRYVSRDGTWVMARDPQVPSGTGNWVFLHRSCFGALPGAIPV
jgi:hypothetical protein